MCVWVGVCVSVSVLLQVDSIGANYNNRPRSILL